MAKKVGLDCTLYRNPTLLSSTTWSGSGWLECEHVKDVSSNASSSEADVSDRANDGYESIQPTLKRIELSVSMTWTDGDVDVEAFRDAWINQTPIAVAALDGDTSGGEGFVSNWYVLGFERTENLEEGVMANFTLKPASYTFYRDADGS